VSVHHTAYAIIRLDLSSIRRDRVALMVVALSIAGTFVITLLGAVQDRLAGWTAWFPLIVAASLVGAPSGFAFLFGMLMVDEGDTGVRHALSVTPVSPTVFMLTRTALVTAWMCVWPLASVYVMNTTWRVIDLPLAHGLAVVLPLAPLTAALALAIPALAGDKVQALAVLKGASFIMLAPLALFVVPEHAWYQSLFLAAPTGWVVRAFRTFVDGNPGYGWALGGTVYATALLGVAAHVFRRNVYRSYH